MKENEMDEPLLPMTKLILEVMLEYGKPMTKQMIKDAVNAKLTMMANNANGGLKVIDGGKSGN